MSGKELKKIVIALDYDPTAKKVAEIGFSFANAMNAEVILLHVIPDLTTFSALVYADRAGLMGFSKTEASHLFEDGIENAMIQFLEKTKEYLGNDTIQTLVKEGDYADTILKAANSLHADCIIMGSHSQKWVENIIMGSVTEKVLRNSALPLIIIPTKKQKA